MMGLDIDFMSTVTCWISFTNARISRDVPVTLGRFLEVVARAERPALPGEDDDPDGRVARGGLERLVQVPHELGHHRVEAVRPVEADVCDAVSHVVEHCLQRHGFSSAR